MSLDFQQDANTSKAGRIGNDKWDSIKEEIHQIYIDQDNTLSTTMRTIEERYALKASERKWKLKLKEWGFEKYLPAAAMKILVAKAERRATVENKETVFFHRETQIPPERIELFKRRKTFREGPMASPSQKTPANVSYRTPYINLVAALPAIPLGFSLQEATSQSELRSVMTIDAFRTENAALCSLDFGWKIPIILSISGDKSDHSLTRDAAQLPPPSSQANQPRSDSPACVVLASRLNTLSAYVYDLSRRIEPAMSVLTNDDWYASIAAIIVEEVLSILPSLLQHGFSLASFSFSGGRTYIPVATELYANTLFTKTIERMLFSWADQEVLPRTMMSAFDVLESIFHRRLEPSYSLKVARKLESLEENDGAEARYRQAIKGFMERNEFGNLTACRNHFGKFLFKFSRDEEALIVLLDGFTAYFRWWSLCSPGTLTGPYFNLPPLLLSPWFAHLKNIMESLQKLHLKMDQDGNFAWVRTSLSRLQNLLKDFTSLSADDWELVLLEAMQMATAYSETWHFDAANLVYEFAAPYLESFSSRTHAFERACAFKDYSKHHEKLDSPTAKSVQLRRAISSIESAYRYDDESNFLNNLFKWLDVPEDNLGNVNSNQQPGPGPHEAFFESILREDAELSLYIRPAFVEVVTP